ncbi:MAG: DUF805 domain-containing protein [Muribaculaceae bacterium]|nr:DUF805 domain-containing protein [Muribaculaceae bacterium]
MNVTFGEAVKSFYSRYADFNGRSTCAEFWYVVLYLFVANCICSFINEWVGYAFSLVNFIPYIAIGVRRMHDIGKSGWWVLINLIPLVGLIWYIILAVKPSAPDNEYGAAR